MALSAAEQYGIELLNRARLNPEAEAARQGIKLNKDLAPGTINPMQKQVLAPSAQLQSAAEGHSSHMLRVGQFAHEGIGNGTPESRINATGYWGSAGHAYAENINYASVGFSNTLQGLTAFQHSHLFHSESHRVNLMLDWVNEIGYGLDQGDFQGHNDISMLTQAFGYRGNTYVTGVAYSDRNGNQFYDIGEGRSGITFSITGASVTSAAAGGYALKVRPSDETAVTISGGRAKLLIDTLGGSSGYNAKLDVVSEKLLLVSTSTELLSGSIRDLKALGLNGISLTGSALANSLWGNSGSNILAGNAGNDKLFGGAGNDKLYGGDGGDQLLGGDGNETLYGGAGSDTLDGGNGSILQYGGDGDDLLQGRRGNDALNGDAGADTLRGDIGSDKLMGGLGQDLLNGGDGNDRLNGGEGGDTLNGGNGDDYLLGDAGDDRINGEAGRDNLLGAMGNDALYGGAGNDTLNGGVGGDSLTGGDGADQFVFGGSDDNLSDQDFVTDFNLQQDVLRIAAGNLNDATSFAEWAVEGQTVLVDGPDLILQLEFGDTITLRGMTFQQLMNANVQIF